MLLRLLFMQIVSEMTYNVSMGTLNPTIPYHTVYAADAEYLRDLFAIAKFL